MGPKTNITVSEIMTSAPVCCHLSDSVQEVIRKLVLSGVNALLVVDDEDRTCGLVSQMDVLAHLAAIDLKKAADIMDRHLVTVEPTLLVEDAARLMIREKVQRLVIPDPVDPARAAGILSASDIIRALMDDEFAKFIPPRS